MNKGEQRPIEFQMPSLRLDGRVALVTGGSRGLGLGMALALAHAGADVAIAVRTKSELAEAERMIQETGRQSLVVPTDVGDMAAVRAMVDQVAAHFDRLDILVNAAGINIRKPPDSFTEAEWDQYSDGAPGSRIGSGRGDGSAGLRRQRLHHRPDNSC